MLLLSSADFFQNYLFKQNSFRNTIRVSNGLDPDQDGHSVGPDLGRNCWLRYSADDIQNSYNSRFTFTSLSLSPSTSIGAGVLLAVLSATNKYSLLNLNASIATKVVCFSRLLKCLRSLYDKPCVPRSDCSYRSSLLWVHLFASILNSSVM